jgi:hypothetical protein
LDAVKPKLEGQLAWTNARVLKAVRSIKASTAEPPVIVVLSDHGFRWDLDDETESTDSLFLAATPGRRGIFPENMTPINLVPRLLNAYASADIALAPEGSYWVDIRQLAVNGVLDVKPVN